MTVQTTYMIYSFRNVSHLYKRLGIEPPHMLDSCYVRGGGNKSYTFGGFGPTAPCSVMSATVDLRALNYLHLLISRMHCLYAIRVFLLLTHLGKTNEETI
ncbi:hypothetical protein CW304_03270 [Bacillus sp. UFRGS-B20]|nr:hypothetical protein CW304_03270 [Bacillus sp. UFRGS-B20]